MLKIRDLMKKYKYKIKEKAAFTLAESLVAMLIMLMASVIMSSGIFMAQRAYYRVVYTANAEVLFSTTMTALRNEIATAQNIKTSKVDGAATETTVVTYFNSTTGGYSRIYLSDGTDANKEPDGTIIPEHTIAYQMYADTDISKGGATTRLVSEAASTDKLYPTYDYVEYNQAEKELIFYNLRIMSNNTKNILNSTDLPSITTFTIRTFVQ